jgi:hypothetical protein
MHDDVWLSMVLDHVLGDAGRRVHFVDFRQSLNGAGAHVEVLSDSPEADAL